MDQQKPQGNRLRLTIDNRDQLECALDSAVTKLLSEGGKDCGQGILVTRHDHGTFTLEFCMEIEHGVVIEKDLRIQRILTGSDVQH